MSAIPSVEQVVQRGAVAGLVGGLTFGAIMNELGLLESIALAFRAESDFFGFFAHLVVAVVIGAGFGLVMRSQRPAVGETLHWGLVYGAAWWFIGPVTLLPLLSGDPIAWDVEAARELVPALLGHLLYGLVTAMVYVPLARGGVTIHRGSVVRGLVGGLGGAVLIGLALDGRDVVPAVSASMSDRSALLAWLTTLAVGAVVGLTYGLINGGPNRGLGPSLIRGMVHGFAWWIVAALTVIPLAVGDGLPWSVEQVRAEFDTFPGYLLFFGAAVALIHHGLGRLNGALLSDDLSSRADEGLGTQGLRATGRGVVAGVVGGLAFTVVMIQIGFLSTVANLVGGDSSTIGFITHLVIASLIGVIYGFAFIRRSNDAGSAVGWGVSYGVLWWLLGPLTLLPILLGDRPTWSVAAATDAYPALIGHVIYGALLGLAFFRLEARHSPWWVSRSEAEAVRTRNATEQILSSAPGVWALVVLIALTMPVLLGGTAG